ncbi:hypothetical protein BH11MYX4_BH11MYX4_24430 [soil metagenome]
MGELRSVRRTVGMAATGALLATLGVACSAADPTPETLGESREALAVPNPVPSTIPPPDPAPVIDPNANLCAASNYFSSPQIGFSHCVFGAVCDDPTRFEEILMRNGCVLGQVGGHRALVGSYPDARRVLHNWYFANCPRFPATPIRLGIPKGSTSGFGPWAAPPLDPEELVDTWSLPDKDPVNAYRREYCDNELTPGVERVVVIFDPICTSCYK